MLNVREKILSHRIIILFAKKYFYTNHHIHHTQYFITYLLLRMFFFCLSVLSIKKFVNNDIAAELNNELNNIMEYLNNTERLSTTPRRANVAAVVCARGRICRDSGYLRQIRLRNISLFQSGE